MQPYALHLCAFRQSALDLVSMSLMEHLFAISARVNLVYSLQTCSARSLDAVYKPFDRGTLQVDLKFGAPGPMTFCLDDAHILAGGTNWNQVR
eukprot:s1881_g13.t1